MLFGLDEYGKQVRKGAAACGEKAAVRPWLKLYKKVRKEVAVTTNHYHQVKEDAQRILAEARELEGYLSRHTELTEQEKTRTVEIGKDFQKTAPGLDFEFVISKADREFHSTLESAAKLAADFVAGKADEIILQSEVENLIYLTKEGLEKEKPDLFTLACFYLSHSDRELVDMSYSMRLEYVRDIYEKNFLEPIRPVLVRLMEEEERLAAGPLPDGKSRKKLLALEPLVKTAERSLQRTGGRVFEKNPEVLAEAWLRELTLI